MTRQQASDHIMAAWGTERPTDYGLYNRLIDMLLRLDVEAYSPRAGHTSAEVEETAPGEYAVKVTHQPLGRLVRTDAD